MRLILVLDTLLIVGFAHSTANAQSGARKENDVLFARQIDSVQFLKGADVSFIPQIEDLGGFYKVNCIPQDPLRIFKDHGFNCIRLKLWHTSAQNYNNLEKILYLLQSLAPIVVLVDEADAALGNRETEVDSGVSQRVFSKIASAMSNTENR